MNYVLLKDLPGTPAGTVFQPTGDVYIVGKPSENGVSSLHKRIVENQSEWFRVDWPASKPQVMEASDASGFNATEQAAADAARVSESLPKKRGRPAGKPVKKSRK